MDDEEREGGGTGIAVAAGWTARQDKGILRLLISSHTFSLGNQRPQFIMERISTFTFPLKWNLPSAAPIYHADETLWSGHSLR